MKAKMIALVGLLVVLLCSFWLLATAAEAQIFYVSPSGSDAWSGKLAAPAEDGSDGPFLTFVRAQEAVRDVNLQDEQIGPVIVMVRGGHYVLDEPIRFTEADSGTETSPIIYTNYPGETPVLSGGRFISGWQKYDETIQSTIIFSPSQAELQSLVHAQKTISRFALPTTFFT